MTTTIEAKTLFEAALIGEDTIDIYDTTYSMGVAFSCYHRWENCYDYYDRLMLLFALNIKCTKTWESCANCKITEFLWENREVFEKFFNENNREGYRPSDYPGATPEKDTGFYEAYILPFESLVIGNYSEEDYQKLYEALAGEAKK